VPILWIAWGFLKSGFGAVLSFCSKPPGSWIAAALAVFLALWWYGNHQFDKGVKWQLAQDAEFIANMKPNQAKATERVRIVFIEKAAEIRYRTKTITERVPEYVTAKDDAACPINRGFVRLHDAAASGTVPGSPARTDGEPSGVALSTVTETVAANYGTAHLCAARLEAWQQWYLAQKALVK
jgi:hypothetical protein